MMLSDERVKSFVYPVDDQSDLDEHPEWKSVDLSIIVTNGVRSEPVFAKN
jgi:hypothetical protein